MATAVHPEDSEYSYIDDGYLDLPDHEHSTLRYQVLARPDQENRVPRYQVLQRLEREKRQERQNSHNQQQTETNMEPMRIKPAVGTDNHASCKRPSWCVWLLVVIGLVLIAGVAAVLVFVLQILPQQQDSQESSTVTLPTVPSSQAAPTLTDCQALYNTGYTTSGVYTISPDGVRQMTVYCEQSLDGGGWTVFQQRRNGLVNFFRPWMEYKTGFGNASTEFWLGNDNIHVLTAGRGQKLMIEMTHPNMTQFYVRYSVFWIEDATNQYRLHVSGFFSTYPLYDGLERHNMQYFVTLDRDIENQESTPCAQTYYGGWWYGSAICHTANLNGLYGGQQWRGIYWMGLTDRDESLTAVRMMVKTV